jgi:hypothetical protein
VHPRNKELRASAYGTTLVSQFSGGNVFAFAPYKKTIGENPAAPVAAAVAVCFATESPPIKLIHCIASLVAHSTDTLPR